MANKRGPKSDLYCPVWPRSLLERRLRLGTARFTSCGLQKHCSGCHEFWPADTEFFIKNAAAPDGLDYNCKACRDEQRYGSASERAA